MAKSVTKELAAWGAPADLCKLVDFGVQTERRLNKDIYGAARQKTEQELYDEEQLDKEVKVKALLQELKEAHQKFAEVLNEVNKLNEEASTLTPWKEHRLNGNTHIKALCDVTTDQVKVTTGEALDVVPNGKPYLVKVKTDKDAQGYLPVLSCTVPLPDKTPQGFTKRLHMHLAAAWVGTLKRHRSAILRMVTEVAKELANNNVKESTPGNDGEMCFERRLALLNKVLRDQKKRASLHRTHEALYCMMQGLEENNNEKLDIFKRIDDVDKLVVYYQSLLKQWQQYRGSLRDTDVPLQIVDSLRHFKPASSAVRVYEVRITIDEVETEETITHVQTEETLGLVHSRSEQVETDRLTAARSEESRKFIIKAVIDRRTEEEISLEDAIKKGIVSPQTGMYNDLTTGDSYPIPVAMNAGFIIVESSTAKRSKEETKEFGLVTIKTLNDKRPYNIDKVIDPLTGEKLSINTAISRGILDWENMLYKNITTRDTMPINEAIQTGWVLVEFTDDGNEPEFLTKTYAIRAVVDQNTKQRVSFQEAVKLGILEKETGTYIHGETGERVYVADAITRGFLKATVVQENEMDISEENKIVVEKVSQIKKKMFKPMGVLHALKNAAVE